MEDIIFLSQHYIFQIQKYAMEITIMLKFLSHLDWNEQLFHYQPT